MSSPISNQPNIPAKNYADEYPEDFPEGGEGYEDSLDGEADVYWNDEEGAGSETEAPLSADSLRAQIQDLLSDPNLEAGQKRALKGLLPQISGAIRQPEKLSALAEKLYQIQDEIYGSPESDAAAGEDGGTGEEPGLTEEMNQLREKILADPNLGDDAKKLLKDLDRLIASADLHQDDPAFLDKIYEQFSQLNEDYMTRSLNGGTGKAQDLADHLKVPVDEVIAAAEAAGVDLENPVAGDKLMKLFQALAVPSSDDLTNYTGIRDKRGQAIRDLNTQADAATANWRMDSEAVPDANVWKQLFEYYNGSDELSTQLKGIQDKMLSQLSGALGALGLSAAAGSEPGRINIDGTEFDFLNEDSGTYKLDTVFNHLTDPSFSAAPRNTEAGDFWEDEAGTFWTSVGHRMPDDGGEGYPVVSFSSG